MRCKGYGSATVRSNRRNEAPFSLHALHQAVVASGAAGLQAGLEGALKWGQGGAGTGSEVTTGTEGTTRG